MADANLTVTKNLKDPEVLQTLLESDLEMSLIHAKLKYGKVAKIDDTLQGRPGSTVDVVAYNYIGPAVDTAEGATITISQLTQQEVKSPKIKKVTKGTALTDEAALVSYGDPVGAIAEQIRLSIRDKMDEDIRLALEDAPLVYDDTVNTAGASGTVAPIRYGSVLNAIGMFEDEELGDYAIFIHPNQRVDLMSDEAFTKVSDATKDTFFFTGAIGKIADADVIVSRRVPTTKVGGAGADKDNIASYTNYIVKPDAVKLLTKRGVLVETKRAPEKTQTEVYAHAHYVCWLEFGDRVVKLKSKAKYGVANTIPAHLKGATNIV